ncbi:hypothetical protein BJ741DRAFT_652962 [Chytriomyces cf. hyalinus JEL632]|nr:hypothetical protein BJ741DRAFT_652962 [Chytriomyces cf. hyalinus JEL632]
MSTASAVCTPNRRPPTGGYSSIVLGTTTPSLPPPQNRSNPHRATGSVHSSPSTSRGSRIMVSNVVFGDDTTHATKAQLEAVASRKQKKSADSSRSNSPHSVSGILPTARSDDLSLKSALIMNAAENMKLTNDASPTMTSRRLVPSRKKSSLTFGLLTKSNASHDPLSTQLQRESKPREIKSSTMTIEPKSSKMPRSTDTAKLNTWITAEKNKSSIVLGDSKQSEKEMTRYSKTSYSGHLNRSTIAIGDTAIVGKKESSASNLHASVSSLAEFAGFGGTPATKLPVSSPMQGAAGMSSGKYRVY